MAAARTTQTGVLLALSAAFMWGVSGAVAADLFSEVSPARVAEGRALITTAVLVPVAWWRGLLNPQDGLRWFFLLGVNLALVNVTFYWAIDLLGVGPGATIQFLGPILVLIWMVVAAKIPHRNIPVGGPLDFARGEQAIGVTVDQQRKHHMRRKLGVTRASMIDFEQIHWESIDRFNHKMNQVIFLHPISQIRWQKHRSVAVYIDEFRGHAPSSCINSAIVQSPTDS